MISHARNRDQSRELCRYLRTDHNKEYVKTKRQHSHMGRQRALTHVQQQDTRKFYCLTVMQFDATRLPGNVVAQTIPWAKVKKTRKSENLLT